MKIVGDAKKGYKKISSFAGTGKEQSTDGKGAGTGKEQSTDGKGSDGGNE